MTRQKKPAAAPAATEATETEPAMPQAGGAFYRSRSTGELVRDRDYEQHVPETELAGDGTGAALPPIGDTSEPRTAGGGGEVNAADNGRGEEEQN